MPEIQRVPLQILPDHWGNLDNYREVFQRQPFARFLANSAPVASISALSSARPPRRFALLTRPRSRGSLRGAR